MKCNEIQIKLSEYLDGALGAQETAALEKHVAECVGCRRELDALRRTVAAVSGLPRCSAPPGFRDKVVQRIRAESAASARPRIVYLWPRLAAVAATLLVAAGVTLLVSRSQNLGKPGARDRDLAMRPSATMPRDEASAAADTLSRGDASRASLADGATAESAAAEADADMGWKAKEAVMAEAPKPKAPAAVEYAPGGAAAPAAPAVVAREMDSRAVVSGPAEGGREGEGRGAAKDTELGLAKAKNRVVSGIGGTAAGKEVAEERLAFRQMALLEVVDRGETEDMAARKASEAVLTVVTDEPLELARKTVEMAKGKGVRGAVMPEGDKAAGEVQVVLNVPREAYPEFRRQVTQFYATAEGRAKSDEAQKHVRTAVPAAKSLGGVAGAAPAKEKKAVTQAADAYTEREEKAESLDAKTAEAAGEGMKEAEGIMAKGAAKEEQAQPATIRLVIRFVLRAEPAAQPTAAEIPAEAGKGE